VSLRTLLYLYGWRIRAHPLQEVFAGAGIAIGVALLFAVLVSNSSLTGSVKQLIGAITGDAQIELAARDDQGFDQRLLVAVRDIPGVRAAAPSLERRAMIGGPRGLSSVVLIGADPSLATLGGSITRNFGPGGLAFPSRGLLLPEGIASHIGVHAAETLTVQTAGHSYRARVVATMGTDQIGPLTGSGVAVGQLAWVQALVGTPDRISRIFVRTEPGAEASVVKQLERISAGRFDVGPADSTVRRLEGVTAPNDQSTALFSAISAMVGLLLAFNAMLLTMPERRRFVVELRTQGFTPAQVINTLLFQAVVLGLLASAVGLVIGDTLSRSLFGSIPTYLSFSFPVGTQRVVPTSAVVIAVGAGIVASVLAASRSFADLHRARALDAIWQEHGDIGEGFDGALRRRLLVTSGFLAMVATGLAVALPRTTLLAVAALAGAVLCAVPTVFAVLVRAMEALARRAKQNMLVVALMSAQSTMTRSVAVVAIAAVAVFGSITLGGARKDLINGLVAGYTDHLDTADVWVTSAGRSLTTDSFRISPRKLARLRRDPMLASVRIYQGGMYDIGERRIWVIARPREDRKIVPASQLLSGSLATATARMRSTGWVCLSTALAQKFGVGVGDVFTLPTPTGSHRFRVAAVTTNLSWGPGAVILNTADYQGAWDSTTPSAIEINTSPGVTPLAGRHAVQRVLGRDSGYDIQTASALEAEFRGVLVEGLARLQQISILMLVSASLALSAALGASIWHRRRRLATYKMQGFSEKQLRRILLLEALIVLSLGAGLGIVAGLVGHLLCDRWLELTTGFPAPFSPELSVALAAVGPVVAFAMLIVAVPGFLAARVSPGLTFQD
jgi:putative ABC transport system permease protein